MTRLLRRYRQRRRAFSAVEIIAVAAVVAMLALILIPKLRSRVEEAREVAVEDELGNMVKYITLAYADCSKYVRLQDYDNNKILIEDDTDPDYDATKQVPLYYYDATSGQPLLLSNIERAAFARRWNGPYVSYQARKKYATIGEMRADTYWQLMLSPNAGPIEVAADASQDLDHYPLDPWGTPYLFFPPESGYNEVLLFSLGPDGLPGSETNPNAQDFYPAERTSDGQLGATGSDDIRWEF